jgi:branched-chain amino acid transport system permease protein
MKPDRSKDLALDLWGVGLIALLLLVPFLTRDPLVSSLTEQVVIGTAAALAVYIMLRMDLMAFTIPAFMAIGGYTAAMLATAGITNLLVLIAASLVVPIVISIPLGAIVLRLKGVYFVFITFIANEILQLVIFETPTLTGGSTGIPGVPPATLFGIDLGAPHLLVLVTVIVGVLAALVTLAVTHRFRPEFSSIEENETLAQSLGVPVWWYRTIGFMACSGVSGLAGFALVNMLSTAHPSSFASFSAVNYIAYAFIGGRATILGPVIGAAFLVCLSNVFSSQGQLAAGLFGVLLIASVMVAPGGLVGLSRRIVRALRNPKEKRGA